MHCTCACTEQKFRVFISEYIVQYRENRRQEETSRALRLCSTRTCVMQFTCNCAYCVRAGHHIDPDAAPAEDAPVGRRAAAVHLRGRRLDGRRHGGRLRGRGLGPGADPLGSWAYPPPDAGTIPSRVHRPLIV